MSRFCSSCGQPIVSNANFCQHCGAQISNNLSNPQGFDTAPESKPSAHIGLPIFEYPAEERQSEIITSDDSNGEPVVKFRNLHPNAVWLFFFKYIGMTSIILLLFIVSVFIEPLLASIALVLYLFFVYLIAKINYKNFEFEITTNAFRKVYGVFHKYSVNIAFDQIQNINMRRSIIDQILGLAHLEIETAGTGGGVKKNVGGLMTHSEGYIPGISPAEAIDVKTLMLARISRQ